MICVMCTLCICSAGSSTGHTIGHSDPSELQNSRPDSGVLSQTQGAKVQHSIKMLHLHVHIMYCR